VLRTCGETGKPIDDGTFGARQLSLVKILVQRPSQFARHLTTIPPLMLVGIISDTNDRFDVMATAVRVLADAGAELFVHCGDIGNRKVLDPLAGLNAAFVWGDRDADRMGLLRHADNLGIQCFGVLGELESNGKSLAVIHGNDAKLTRRLVKEKLYDYLLVGHSKVAQDERQGRTRLISPGSLEGAEKTVVLLDTETDTVQVINV
jgi:putative phosphoesterase